MGTRADFYVGRGVEAEWLGSIAFDGYPGGLEPNVLTADTEERYRKAVASLLADCDHATLPADGWPWPWEDSGTTDFAYAFDGAKVWASCFGGRWLQAPNYDEERERLGEGYDDLPEEAAFPNMKARQNVTLGRRSGILIIGG